MDDGDNSAPARERRAGARAAAAWLSARGLYVPPKFPWEVSIVLDVARGGSADTRFHLTIDSQQWGFVFAHGSYTSWLRVADVAYIHERDDFRLLGGLPPLRSLGSLVHTLEDIYKLSFGRREATIETNIAGAEPKIRAWLVAAM